MTPDFTMNIHEISKQIRAFADKLDAAKPAELTPELKSKGYEQYGFGPGITVVEQPAPFPLPAPPPDAADPYADLKTAHAAGKVIQAMNLAAEWEDIDYPPLWNLSPGKCRIKPEPETKEVELGPEDIPPNSVVKSKAPTQDSDAWSCITAVNNEGVVIVDSYASYAELREKFVINRPRHRDADGNPTLWEPCHKLATVTP